MEKTLLGCMNNILEKLKDPDGKRGQILYDDDKLDLIQEEVLYLKEQMGLSPVQSVLFSVLVQKSSGRCNMDDVAEYMGISYIKFLTYKKELDEMWDKWLIRRKRSEIMVPSEVLEELGENRPYRKPQTTGLSTRQILVRMASLFKLLDKELITCSQLMREVDEIMYNNPETSIGRTVKKYLIKEDRYCCREEERFLLFLLIFLYDARDDDMVCWRDIYDFFDSPQVYDEMVEHYLANKLQLQKKGIIEYTESEGLMEKDFFHIKDSIKLEMLADRGGLHKKLHFACDLSPKDITSKELFYNRYELEQIAILEDLLSQEKLNRVYESLKEKGLRTGFTVLFYGPPGTGKTETAYQLAKKTGRKIIMADVSKLKNCYVGETEKNIKMLFQNYRMACNSEELTPILLFNEADAILGIRKEQAKNAVDKMENSIQNIILQEMETLSGILIATTNMTENFDKAFERRFLYKIKFNRPSFESKVKIWKSVMPQLAAAQIESLAGNYDFSGGQIENIVRKYEIQSVLSGEDPGYESVCNYCKEEQIEKTHYTKRIGF